MASAVTPAAAQAAPTASPHQQWVLAPDVLPVPTASGDIPPLPVARSANDPGFHPDIVQRTATDGDAVILTCLNPETGKTEVIVGKTRRDTVFALKDPQREVLPTAPVQDVQAGDLVASRDPLTGRTGYRRVTATVSRPAPALVTLSLSDPSTGKAESLACTPDHPLYVQGKGWVEAGDLGAGTQIVTRAGPPVVVKDVQWQRDETGKRPFTVYNLTVQGEHTYFAGNLGGGVWVHNGCLPENEFPGVHTDKQSQHDPTDLANWRPFEPRSGNPTTPFDPTQLPPGKTVEDALTDSWNNPIAGRPAKGQVFGRPGYPLNSNGDMYMEMRYGKNGVHGWPVPAPY